MFLKRVRLKNVRCFKDIELDFHEGNGGRKSTVLLGENGTGKSTLLKAIALVTGGSDALSDLVGEPDDWLRYGSDLCEIEGVLVTAEGEERRISIVINSGDSRRDVLIKNDKSLELINKAIQHSTRNYFVAGYGASRRLSTRRGMQTKTSAYYSPRAESVATIFDPEATLNPLESWAMDLDYMEGIKGIDTVRKVLNDFLPGAAFSHIDKERGRLMFKTVDGVVPLMFLSDGYQCVSAWIGDLLYRITDTFEDYRSPLKARGLLLIDEVDLHLHPTWQRQLISFLAKKLPNFQIVITTHSPMTAQQAGPMELHTLHREAGRISVHQFEGNPRNLLVSQLLMTDVFGLDTDESLEVEEKKNRYRKLRDKKDISKREKTEMKNLTDYLRNLPEPHAERLKVDTRQVGVLEMVQKELDARKL